LEGGAIFAASAALFQELTFENGRLQQTISTLPVMRMNECPEIETHMWRAMKNPAVSRAGRAVHSPGYRELQYSPPPGTDRKLRSVMTRDVMKSCKLQSSSLSAPQF